jgi:4-amino-4-deoxy-L-arabinose transferase-like glycosyltransferase
MNPITDMNVSPILQRFDRSVLLLLVLSCFLFFYRLGVPGLMDPDEGRYAEIAREMLVLGDFITPQLNFLPYLEKPPLVYWLTAISLKVGGLNEWAARLIPALSALAGIMAVYWLAAKLWGRKEAFLAGLVMATSSGYVLLGRLLTLDMTLTACLIWGIALAYLAVRNQQRQYLPWAYLALGLGMLTKGPVAIVLPALIFLTWFGARGQWRGVFQLWHLGGALMLAVVVLPWYILAAWRNTEFLSYFFFQEHLQRFLAPRVHGGQPVYFYLGVLAVGFLPWIFLVPWAWQASRFEPATPEAKGDRLFLACWFGVIFVFFSLARAKLFPYLLPGLPPLALLVARALAGEHEAAEFDQPRWRRALHVWLAAGLLLILAWISVAAFFPSLWERLVFISPFPLAAGLVLALPPLLLLTGLMAGAHRQHLLLGSALLLSLVLLFAGERVAETRSPKPLAQVINSRWQADDVIVGFHHYSQSISFYTGQPMYLFQTRGELDFGLQQRPENPYYLNWPVQLPALLHQRPGFFVIIDQNNLAFWQTLYREPITILAQWKNYLLISKS